MNSQRNSRIEDFKRRAAYSPDAVYYHRSRGWLYIPVHDFADESATNITSADCWCLFGTDAALLECMVSMASSLQPGLYAQVDDECPYWPKLYAVIPEPLTRAAVETAMQRFVELGFPDTLLSELRPGDSLVRLAT